MLLFGSTTSTTSDFLPEDTQKELASFIALLKAFWYATTEPALEIYTSFLN